MKRRPGLLALLALLTVAAPASAASPYSYCPADSLLFAVVPNPAKADEAVSRLSEVTGVALPRLVDLARSAGLKRGIDANKPWLFALRQISSSLEHTAPAVMLPVTDYAEFARSVQGDESGEPGRIQLLGEEVVVARRGEYALLMNVEHEFQLRALIRQPPNDRLRVRNVEERLADSQVVVLLRNQALKLLMRPLPASRASLRARDVGVAERFHKLAWPYVGSAKTLLDVLNMRPALLGVGIKVEADDTARAEWVVAFSGRMGVKQENQPAWGLLDGFPDGSFVTALGGPVTETAAGHFVRVMTELEKQNAEASGYGSFGPQQWDQIRECYDLLTRGVTGVSLLLRVPDEDEPLFAALAARARVGSPEEYLQQVRRYFEVSAELSKQSESDIRFDYEIEDRTFGESAGVTVSLDLLEAAGDENNDVWQLMLQKALGADRKLRMHFADDGRGGVAFAMQSEDALGELLAGDASDRQALADNPQVLQTLDRLGPTTGWSAMIRPGGYVTLWERLLEMLTGGWGGVPDFPEFGDSPPIGLSTGVDANLWFGQVVLHPDTLRAGVGFLGEIDAKFGR